MRELFHSTKTVNALSAITSVTNEALVGAVIDRAGYESVLFEINIGAKTDGTIAVLVEHDDASGFGTATAVDDADLIGTEAAAGVADAAVGADGIRKIGYVGEKRYVRITLTTASNAGSVPVSVVANLFGGRHLPAQGADGAAVTQTP